MHVYLDTLQRLLEQGVVKSDRTGTGTRSLFGQQLRFDLRQGFPLLTTKKVHFKSLAVEMLWFLSGATNIRPLLRHGVTIWSDWPHQRYCKETGDDISQAEFNRRVLTDDAFAERYGDLGPVYGSQWRSFNGSGIDQVQAVIEMLRRDPDSRRLLVSAWNPVVVDRQMLPPCHYSWQLWTRPLDDGCRELSLHCTLRSNDAFLGLPFNAAQYALLTHMIAAVSGMSVGDLVLSVGDLHLYSNHVEQAKEQLTREPRPLPRLNILRVPDSIFDFRYEDFELLGYDPHPPIKAPVAVGDVTPRTTQPHEAATAQLERHGAGTAGLNGGGQPGMAGPAA